MKIISYSDLHFEFQHHWWLPPDVDGDILVLAGDIITFKDFTPLESRLRNWKNPVLFVAGNHEYYTRSPMRNNEAKFKAWLAETLPQVYFLRDEAVTLGGVNFFGGTMWTDFKSEDLQSMSCAAKAMYDYQYIKEEARFTPEASVRCHLEFTEALRLWFEQKLSGPHVVITHHAPVINPKSQHLESPLQPAFVSYDMKSCIETFRPDLWIYGHTHECDAQLVGRTQIISNQLGYPNPSGGYECSELFDAYGCPVEL